LVGCIAHRSNSCWNRPPAYQKVEPFWRREPPGEIVLSEAEGAESRDPEPFRRRRAKVSRPEGLKLLERLNAPPGATLLNHLERLRTNLHLPRNSHGFEVECPATILGSFLMARRRRQEGRSSRTANQLDSWSR